MADSDKTGSELASLDFQELLSGLEAGVPAVEPTESTETALGELEQFSTATQSSGSDEEELTRSGAAPSQAGVARQLVVQQLVQQQLFQQQQAQALVGGPNMGQMLQHLQHHHMQTLQAVQGAALHSALKQAQGARSTLPAGAVAAIQQHQQAQSQAVGDDQATPTTTTTSPSPTPTPGASSSAPPPRSQRTRVSALKRTASSGSDRHTASPVPQPPARSSGRRKRPVPTPADDDADADGSAQKKPRFVWTADVHQRFVEAVHALGIHAAKPQAISQLMRMEGPGAPTRQNIKSHLQKYRLLLQKRAASDPHAAHPYAALHGGGGYGQWPAAAQQAAEQQVLLASLGGGGWQAAAFANAGLHAALAGGGGGGGAGGGAASAAADQANLADIVPGVGELEAYQQAHAQLQLQLYLQGRLGGAGALDGLT